MSRRLIASLLAASTLALGACASWSPEAKGTAIGAGAGAAVGNLITGGGVLGTIGGAAAGGIIGHEVGKEQKKK
jgi:osmotically inducible lipoprotein OsmB